MSQLACQKRQSRSWLTFWRSPKAVEEVGDECRYVCLRGRVGPLDKTMLLHGSDEKNLGVIQRIVTKEVSVVRNGTSFWSVAITSYSNINRANNCIYLCRVDEKRIVKNVQQEVPWGLTSESMKNGTVVHVIDGLSADRLDMPTIRDQFIPAPFSLSSWCEGWIAGKQLKGTQEVEELLLDGTVLTAVGELVVSKDGSFQLRSPADSKQSLPFILSNLPYISLMNGYEALISVCKWSLVFFGGIGIYLGYAMLRRWLRARSTRRPNREEDDILRELRESRRPNDDDEDIADWQRCVVCLMHNREVIILPCGHICLCADCMILINEQQPLQRNCPICRQQIEQVARAFVP